MTVVILLDIGSPIVIDGMAYGWTTAAVSKYNLWPIHCIDVGGWATRCNI